MTTCIQAIQSKIDANQLDTITELVPNTLMPLSISPSIKQLFRLEIVKQETAGFTISLTSSVTPSNVGVTINIYQLTGNLIVFLGSVLVTEMILTFQKDFSVGSYIICISSTTFTYRGTLIGQFTGYPVYAKLVPSAASGQALNNFELSFAYVEKHCEKLLYFQIIDGHLPEGLYMTLTGDIWGILPNLDCTHDDDALSPSQNWYYEMDNTWQPWGNQWRFKIRVWIFDYPTAFAEQWFCIRIHNNWSWDRDNKPPIEIEEEVIDIIAEEPIPEICCEGEDEPTPFVPQSIPMTLCPCEEETTTEQAVVLNFLQWYESVLKNPPGEDNPYIQTFIDNFRKTEYFKTMMEKAGLSDELLTPEEKEIKAVNSLIKLYTDQLIDGTRRKEDIDFVMLQLKDQENQKLPITILTTTGTYLTLNLVD